MPWKNGGGITREIAAFPEGADLADFEWRISMADVASDGPFSRFEGVDRTLCVLEGSIELTLQGGKAVVLDPNSAPLGFPADEDVVARLPGGPVRDFNVMTRREAAKHRVESLEINGKIVLNREAKTLAIVCASGSVVLSGSGGEAKLEALDCLLFDRDSVDSVHAEGRGRLIVARIL
ncbi:environmental stress-induced protein Ves [Limibacillus sp. MBR-115]|jgi:environmental stress-induced protein Ves